ncbi:MAG: alanine racemase [Phenylobacterium zucineum]|nr:MAG: alanine racemase [Phenylobacterium zucineum]
MAPPEFATGFAGGRLHVDLDALGANYRAIRAQVGAARVGAVVKADAYGLGAAEAASHLAGLGCRDFFVAILPEALALAQHLPSDARLYVLNGLPPGAESLCADSGIRPVLNSLEQTDRWRSAVQGRVTKTPAAIQIDSGMSRLGMSATEVEALADDPGFFADAPIALVMSHLACAENTDAPANAAQREAFDRLASLLPTTAERSLGNSAGAFHPADLRGDLVRPGLALYGATPSTQAEGRLQPVVRLEARVLQLRSIPAGIGVGYGLTYVAPTPRRIATLSVGYADGWPRALSGVGQAWAGDIPLPILGRVSMDSMVVDVSELAPGALAEGDFVELIGPHQTLDQVAASAGITSYELLTGFGRRLERIYHRSGK